MKSARLIGTGIQNHDSRCNRVECSGGGREAGGKQRLEVHRILKIRTPYSRILSSILKGLPHLGIEYFRLPESLVKLNDLVGIEYLEVPESLVVPNDLVGIEYLEVTKSLVVPNDLV